jgi:hypothetical protein
MAAWYALRLAVDRGDVRHTYRYNEHLEQVSSIDRAFRRFLGEHPRLAAALAQPTLFLDREPDLGELASCSDGSLGREYRRLSLAYEAGRLQALRALRLATLPHERIALDPSHTERATDEAGRLVWLRCRRNLYMTASHDLMHLVAGCDMSLEGEALVAMYQFHHLRMPQNFMNMAMARLGLAVTLHAREIRRIRRARPRIAASVNPLDADWETLWPLPLAEARRRLRLPAEGLQRG